MLPEADALWALAEMLAQRTGIFFGKDNLKLLSQRVSSVCHELNLSGAAALLQLIRRADSSGHAAFASLVRHVTVNHTTFFREEEAMHKVLELAQDTLKKEAEVRVWSAASASGEELYSLAMLLVERFGYTDVEARFKLLGTDINHLVVGAAERAVYTDVRASRVPEPLRAKYLTRLADGNVQIVPRLRQLCTFRRLNLITGTLPFQRGFHLVYLRNVLYYFDHKTQEKVVRSIHGATKNTGYLVTSVSESIDPLGTPYRRVLPFVYQRDDFAAAPALPLAGGMRR